MVDCVWNVMAQAQKVHFVFRRNGRVHLNRWGRQFSRLLAAEFCASAAVVMLDTACSEVVWRVLVTQSIRQFPLHFPIPASPCAITFQLESTRFRPSAKRTSPFKSAGVSVQSTTGSRGVRISSSKAGYTMFRDSVKSTGYPIHSPVSPSLPLPCVTVCHHISTGPYDSRYGPSAIPQNHSGTGTCKKPLHNSLQLLQRSCNNGYLHT